MRTIFLLLIAFTCPALAEVVAEGAWSRATSPQQQTGAAYVTLRSTEQDRLVAVSSPAATQVQLHQMTMEGSVMRMREMPGIPLPPGQPVRLAPGGLHLMLVGLRTPLMPGAKVELHLTFEHAPPLDIVAVVQPASATGPATASHH